MDETKGTARRLRAIVATTLVTCLVAALMALVGSTTASAATVVGTTAGAKSLSSCKQKAVSSCRKVTARKCRASKIKKIRARGDKVNRRKVTKTCARVAKRHCKKAAQKRKQAAIAKRCAAKRTERTVVRGSGVTPTAASTGVPAGTRLKVVRGDLTISKAGTVVDGLDVRGFVTVKASNVTIKNSIIRGRDVGPKGKGALIAAYGDHTDLVIKDSTLAATYPSMYVDGLKGRNFTASRLDISKVVDTAVIFGGTSTTIVDSWLHDNLHYATGDTTHSDGKTHDDNIQIEGGSGISIANNRIEGSDNAAIMITQNYSRTSGVQVVDNLLVDGGCTVNMTEQGKGPILDFTILDNKFGPSAHFGTTCPMRIPRSSSVKMSNNMFVTNKPANPVMF
ncbi:hypothetical protein [Solicola sp. PLA-1-18]|uniref:hypothetical protein n=1 Tax=Solicola sp. PLA-1-18 TaxID=3380532 RepID=UPI003B7C01A5